MQHSTAQHSTAQHSTAHGLKALNISTTSGPQWSKRLPPHQGIPQGVAHGVVLVVKDERGVRGGGMGPVVLHPDAHQETYTPAIELVHGVPRAPGCTA